MAFGLSSGAMSLIGGGLGLLAGGDSQQSQSSSKEPWKASQPWLQSNLASGQGLQNYYQQNPFNPQQQTGYQNTFGDLDAFRNQMAPGLMDFANKLMGSSYQRGPQQSGTPQGRQSLRQGNGMMPLNVDNRQRQQPQQTQQGLLGGPFSVAQGQSYGPVDFAAQNPFTNGSIDPTAAPDAKTVQELVAAEMERQRKEKANMNGEQYGGF